MAIKKPVIQENGQFSVIQSGDAISVDSGGTGLTELQNGGFLKVISPNTFGFRTPAQVLADIGAVLKTGDSMTGELVMGVNAVKFNNTALYSPIATEDILNIRRYGLNHTLVNVMAPPQTVWGGAREATFALVRGDNNEYFLDLYNMDYGKVDAGNYLDYGNAKMGLRMQKRGAGTFTPFYFEYSAGLAEQRVLELYPGDSDETINDTRVVVTRNLEVGGTATIAGYLAWHSGNLSFGSGLSLTDGVLTSISSAAWGNISGTLANQTDLQNALDTKLAKTGGSFSGSLFISNGDITFGSGAGFLDMNNHNITGVNKLTFADPGIDEGISWIGANNWQICEAPDTLLNGVGNMHFVSNGVRKFTVRTDGSVDVPSGPLTVGGNILVNGDILPSLDNIHSLGSPTLMWKDVYIGPGSLYINGQKILEDTKSGTIRMTADIGQNISIQTLGTGDVELAPQGSGVIQLKGTVLFDGASKIRTSNGQPLLFDEDVMFSLGTGFIGGLKIDGFTAWHSGSFSPSSKLDVGGTAASALKWSTARTITLAGKAAGSVSFDGSSNVSLNVTSLTVTKADVGLGSVDNTTDLQKPISTATQTALTSKADKSELFSKNYNDLTNKPVIPAAQVNSDWNAATGITSILNKPTLATVATSGSYNDLSNKPAIPAGTVTSITAGNGMTFTTITVAGVVTLGTPSTITTTSTDQVTANSHTHKINLNWQPATAGDIAPENGLVTVSDTLAFPELATTTLTAAPDRNNRSFQISADHAGGTQIPRIFFRTRHSSGGGGGWTALQEMWHSGNFVATNIPTQASRLLVEGNIPVGLILNRTGSAANAIIEMRTASGSVFFGQGPTNTFAVGGVADLNTSANRWFHVNSTGAYVVTGTTSHEVYHAGNFDPSTKANSIGLTNESHYFTVKSFSEPTYGVGSMQSFYDAVTGRWNLNARDSAGAVVPLTLRVNNNEVWHAGNLSPALTTTSITAGNGLTGGGTLAATRTLTLGTPGTITNATTNSVTATSHTHALTVTKADVGLGNADNTSDANKPVSTATQTALNSKVNVSQAVRPSGDPNTLGGTLSGLWVGSALNTPMNYMTVWNLGMGANCDGQLSWQTTPVNGVSDLWFRRRHDQTGTWDQWAKMWNSGNFDPNTKANLDSPSFTGTPAATGGKFTISGWTGNNNLGVLYLGGGGQYIYSRASDIEFYSLSGGYALLNSGGTILTTGNFNPDTKANLAGAAFTGNISAPIYLSASGSVGEKYRVGDDAGIWDVSIANTFGIRGAQNANEGYISFGSGNSCKVGFDGSKFVVNGNEIIHNGVLNRVNAQTAVGDVVGGRLGYHCLSIGDWNTAVGNGYYMSSGAANAPAAGWIMGRTVSHNSIWCEQEAWAFTSADTPKIRYRRSNNGGTWGPWTSNIVTDGNVGGSRVYAGWDSGTTGSVSCNNWFRSNGNTGWYSATHSGGVYMTDSTYLRSYNDKAMMASDFVMSSDASLKTNVTDFKYQGRLRPVGYNMISTGERQIGFIAQEVMAHYPDLVSRESEDATWKLSYPKVTVILSAQLNQVESRTEGLEAANQQLQQRVKELEQKCDVMWATIHKLNNPTNI